MSDQSVNQLRFMIFGMDNDTENKVCTCNPLWLLLSRADKIYDTLFTCLFPFPII